MWKTGVQKVSNDVYKIVKYTFCIFISDLNITMWWK